VTAARWLAVAVVATSLAGACVAALGHWHDPDLARRTAGLFIAAALGTLASWAVVELFIDIAQGKHNG
jgi:hypothetical protein